MVLFPSLGNGKPWCEQPIIKSYFQSHVFTTFGFVFSIFLSISRVVYPYWLLGWTLTLLSRMRNIHLVLESVTVWANNNGKHSVIHSSETVHCVIPSFQYFWLFQIPNSNSTYNLFNISYKNSTPTCYTILCICWLMLWYVLALAVGRLQGAFFNTCSLCFNLDVGNATYD